MALGVSATVVAFALLFSVVALSHCRALDADPGTNASSSSYNAVAAVVTDAEGLLRLPTSDGEAHDDVAELLVEVETVKPVAEPDPDRSRPDSDVVADEELATKSSHDGESKDDDKREEKRKTKKHHCGDEEGRKDKAKKHHHRQTENEEEDAKKRIHRHHHAEESSAKKKSKRSHHTKNGNNGDDDDSDDDEEEEKKAKLWRKKSIKSMFGHGRRSQREEADKDKVNN